MNKTTIGFSLLLGAALAGAGQAAESTASPSTVPAEAFFNFADMYQPLMSPDGDAVAVLVRNKVGRRQLAVLETADVHKARIVASFSDQDIAEAHWVDDQRLVFSVRDESESAAEQRGNGLWAIDRTGDNLRALIYMRGQAPETGTHIKSRTLAPREYGFGQILRDGSGDIIVDHFQLDMPLGQRWWHIIGITPQRLDTRMGTLHEAVSGKLPDHVHEWAFDDQGRVKLALARVDGQLSVMTPEADGSWKTRTSFPSYGMSPGSYSIDGVGADGQVYVLRNSGDAFGSRALYRLDLQTGQPEPTPLVHAKGFDVSPALIQDRRQHRVLGVHFESDAESTAWFDQGLAALQAKVDAHLPGLVNRIDVASCGCAQRVLVTSASDHQPPFYTLYDRSDDTLIPIGFSRPAVEARQMADTDFVRIKARDGHDLPVYVTKPHGKGPWPAVVLVHGGPYLRGSHWEWDGESQFLASRGYLVVRPEFRGSHGFGDSLFEGGFKQWGLKMQDDIADATTWAAQQGLADARRTCIAGGSYGGYATLMGLVRYPDLYRCGVAWAAVTDINLMYDLGTSDLGEEWKSFGMPVLIGDQEKDAAQLEATSPLRQAAHITRPLLLAHGGIDRRVPIEHAMKLRNALEANHAPVTWIEYKDEGHGWYKPETRVDFYKRMETFLAENIGPGTDAKTATK